MISGALTHGSGPRKSFTRSWEMGWAGKNCCIWRILPFIGLLSLGASLKAINRVKDFAQPLLSRRPVQFTASGSLQVCASEVRTSRSVLSGNPPPAVGWSVATACKAAATHYLKLTSRLWSAWCIFRSNDSIALWGLDVISRLKRNIIFLRSRILAF